MKRKLTVISCPSCGREYLPSEIFVPKSFFGAPDIIRRDSEGKIIDILGTDMDLKESFQCYDCDKVFTVTADVSFNTHIDEKLDFSTPYTTTMGSRFELAED